MRNPTLDPMTGEVVVYWRQILATLRERRLLRERPRRGGVILPEADAYVLPDRVVFVLDMRRLGGISRETWLDEQLWKQWRAALQGRRVFVADGGGLAICVSRRPGEQRRRLPAVIPLHPDHLPEEPYHVCLGYSRRGRVDLDLAVRHRAILIGGTTGSGKTNLMQSIVLQLAMKHRPGEVQFAIVDTKEVDFGASYERLPHLFAPVAHDLADCHGLIEQVEQERLRRQALMASAGVADWKDYNSLRREDPLPLLVLVVDEAADFAGSPAMKTLVEIARKGRAFGIGLVLATQHPESRVISPQVRANLPTAIAFQTRTDVESRVILGRKGAEGLNRRGLVLLFYNGRWVKVQTLRVDPALVREMIAEHTVVERPALTPTEQDLIRYAVEHLGGAFIINRLYEVFKGRVSKRWLTALAQAWERRGWLTQPASRSEPRYATEELLALAGIAGGDVLRETAGRRTTAAK